MSISHAQNNPARTVPRTIAGVALMLLGVALIGYGAHYLTVNGNCSGTGYTEYGPVPTCHGPEALYIMSVFFLGPALAIAGWLMARAWGLLWPAVCVSVGAGMITLRYDGSAPAGARAFGLAAGVCFAALAVLSVVVTVRKRRRRKAASPQAAQAADPYAAGPHALG
jgi:hypothetical protein